jgi:hypothetical protein
VSVARLGAARPVLIITAIVTSLIGHAVRTEDTALPGHWMWWGLFALASATSAIAALNPTRWTVGIAGAATITVVISRALVIVIDSFIFDTDNATAPLLAITVWLYIAYLVAHVFYRLASRQEA